MDKVNEKATIYDYIRMCKSFEQDCRDCPLFTPNDGRSCRQVMEDTPNKANEIILNWCEEHPVKTRQSELLKMFPNAKVDSNGVIDIAPCTVEKGGCAMIVSSWTVSDKYTTCAQCRKEYWLAEVEE